MSKGSIYFISSNAHILHTDFIVNNKALKKRVETLLKWCRNSELNQGHRDFQSNLELSPNKKSILSALFHNIIIHS